MSTAVATIDTTKPAVPFSRLFKVELRKMFDTRASMWLMISTGILIVLTLGICLLVVGLDDGTVIKAAGFSQIMSIPLSLLLPVFAIVTITGEWGQRSHLSLFTLEPRRSKIIGAKLAAVLVLAVTTIVIAILLGAVGNVLGASVGGYDTVWNLSVSDVVWAAGLQIAFFLMAFALSMLFLNSAATIVVFYIVALLLPMMVYPPLYFNFDWAKDLIPWLDFNYAAAPLSTGEDFDGNAVSVGAIDYVRFIFALLLWVVVPGLVGLRRVLKTEVK